MKPMTKDQSNSPEPWFAAVITSGLQALNALNPEGCPGADVLPATMQVWTRDLWNDSRRTWNQHADRGCILAAFADLRATCIRWPTPAKFWAALPGRPEPTSMMIGDVDAERRRDQLECERRWRKGLGLPETFHA